MPSLFDVDDLEALAGALPAEVRFGPSSWTYPGWTGLIYEPPYPKKGASTALLGPCASYPLFRTVGIDSAFYAPPSPATLVAYAAALPDDFRCVSKVWQEITVHTWSKGQDRNRAGQVNGNFLNADLFVDTVLGPYQEHFAEHMGPFVFEFPAFRRQKDLTPEWFAEALDRFLGQLPRSAMYSVELRSADFLTPMYLEVLRNHGVAHALNAWTHMPTIGEQLDAGAGSVAEFLVCRALLRPGMMYGESVDRYAPFNRIQGEDPVLRAALLRLMAAAVSLGVPAYVIVNNRTEGCAPLTIAALARIWKERMAEASDG